MVVVAAGARAVPGTAIKRDPLGRRVGHVELRAVATRIERYGPRVESDAIQRIRDGAHGTIEFFGSVRALELRIRGHLDTQALLGGLGPLPLLPFLVAGRLTTRLAGTIGFVIGTARGNDLAHAHAALGRDGLSVARAAPVRRAARAATATTSTTAATTARRGRAGCPQQHGGEDHVVRCHRPHSPRQLALARVLFSGGFWFKICS